MARETKTTIIRQIHEKYYTFNGKSYKPKDYFKSWCEDNGNTLAISRLTINELIRYRDFPNNACYRDTNRLRYLCDIKCVNCDDKCATHKVFKSYQCGDAFNDYVYNCDECYNKEYPNFSDSDICHTCKEPAGDSGIQNVCQECWKNSCDSDDDSDDDTDWDKTPREVAPPIPVLPDWVKEEGKRLTDAKKVPPPIPFLPDWVREESRKHIKSTKKNFKCYVCGEETVRDTENHYNCDDKCDVCWQGDRPEPEPEPNFINFIQRQRFGNISVNFSPELLKALQIIN